MNDIQNATASTGVSTTDAAAMFRETAAENMKTYADETVHQLLDRFVDLSKVIAENTLVTPPQTYREPNTTARVAMHERSLVTTVAQTRFGITFFSNSDSDF